MSAQAATGCLAVLFFLQLQLFPFSGAVIPVTNDPEEAFLIAREAYPFFVPVINNWRFLFVTTRPSPSAVFDTFEHGEDFRAPNENVIYSVGWVDLRQEPRVVTVPQVQDRYYSLQIVDGYTHNIGIVSERTFPRPTQSGKFIVAGPGQCSPPETCICKEVDGIFYSESVFALLLIRLQAFSDLDVELFLPQIQQQFGIERLSDFCDVTGSIPDDLPFIFFVPIQATGTPDFFNFANLIMEFITIHPSEEELFEEFARIGVVPGQPFPPPDMSDEVLEAIQLAITVGRVDVEREIRNPSMADERGGWQLVLDPPQFGTREVMQGRYLARAAAARGAIYGLDPEEVLYPFTRRTRFGFPLNGEGNTPYYILFRPLTLPPVFGEGPLENLNTEKGLSATSRRGFWSITMQDTANLTTSFVPNPIDRFSIGSRELSILCRNDDGSIPIIIQAEEPEEEGFRRNWLPAPDSSFLLVGRLYAPRPRAFVRPYLPPPVRLGLPPEVPKNCPPLTALP